LAEILAGESAADEIDGFQFVSAESGDIVIAFNLGPMFREYPPAERIYLHLPSAFHPGAFQAEVQAADAGEEGTESHLFFLSPKNETPRFESRGVRV
jgi:hypothetical protein